jgi:AcrR family transcriptional regulator
MATQDQPRRGRKPTLSREIVIEAALDLIDSDGLGALNLRKLADWMGISAMTPYHYFADKADLLSAMIEYAMTPLTNDLDPNLSSDRQIGAAMRDLNRILDHHPGVVDLIIAESDKLRLDEFRQSLIATLQKAGLTRRRSADILRSLTSYVLGYSMLNRLRPEQPNRSVPPDSFEAGLEMMMRSLREELDGNWRAR